MSKKIALLSKLIILILLATASNAFDLKIVPPNKPFLNKEVKERKILKNIIKPKEKPQKKTVGTEKSVSEKKLKPKKKPKKKIVTTKETTGEKKIKPKKKPQKKIVTTEETIDENKISEEKTKGIIIPKTKPLLVKKEIDKSKTKSKYFRQKDFVLAKKAIKQMEKRQWTKALSISKKAKDKSIYNFIHWKYLLTTGNKASFYEYKIFIDKNKNYPRIGRIKYLAEHKLSTKKISPKKIIRWFGVNEPLSGYGKLILGESLIATGNIEKGINLIKDGWITAKLSRADMKFFRKKYKNT